MTLRAGLVTAGVVIVLLAVLAETIQHSLYVNPSEETESAFYRNFTPADIVKRFSCESGMSSISQGDDAEIGYATHRKDFDQYFAIQASDWILVAKSLQEDISSRLSLTGAQILHQTGDPAEGVSVYYKSGKSLGIIRVEPLRTVDAATHVLGPGGVCKGGAAVHLRLSLQEKWYKKEPGAKAEWTGRPT